MSGITNKLKKIAKMDKKTIVKKLLSFDDVYVTGYRKYSDDTFLGITGHGEFDAVPTSKRYWYADPVIYTRDSSSYLFMEAFDKKKVIGRIAVCELTVAGATKPKVIIREPFHMSFPMVFDFRGETYMIPETSADDSIRLYKAVVFPDKWETVKVFKLGRKFVDTAIISKTTDSIRILTCEVSPYKEYECRFQKFEIRFDEEKGFSIEEDVKFNSAQEYDLKSRNGGNILTYEGKRYVAAQESKQTSYGIAMDFYPYSEERILLADKAKWRIPADDIVVKGAPKGDGVHSYCHNDAYEVIDLKYMEWNPLKYVKRVLRRH